MVSKAQLRYIRISAQKARLVVPLIKGKRVDQALQLLAHVNQKASPYFVKLIKSALSNAQQKGYTSGTDLFIADLAVNDGPALKRFRAASFGRASVIRKRTSHFNIGLDAYALKGK